MDWNQAKDVILGFLGAGICTILVYEVHELRTSVAMLNAQLAILLERTASHETRISRLEATNDTE